jgi:Zn-dependent protease with chaperone function
VNEKKDFHCYQGRFAPTSNLASFELINFKTPHKLFFADFSCPFTFSFRSKQILYIFAAMKAKGLFYLHAKADSNEIEIQIDIHGIGFYGPHVSSQNWTSDSFSVEKLTGAEKWILRNSKRPDQTILIQDIDFLKQIRKSFPQTAKKQIYSTRSISKSVAWISFMVLVILASIVMIFWKGTPLIADFVATSVPQEWENKLGNDLIKEVLAKEKVDHRKTALIRTLYSRLKPLPTSGEKNIPIEITVVQKDEFNAFAIPGRKIVVYTGAINILNSYPELLALLGHESGHVEGRHSMRTLFRSLSTYALLSFFVGDISGIAAVLIQNAESLYSMSYSREFERDSDRQSHKFLCLNRIDQNGSIRLMKAMKKQVGSLENKDLAFLNSHPLTDERIENAKQEILQNPCNSFQSDTTLESLFTQLKM